MRFTHSINAVKCQEWGINLAQGALFDLLNQASSWAKPQVIEDEVFYWVSRNKVIDEIPLAYSKPDTVYRALKILAAKELIYYAKIGKKDMVRLTEKGKTWNVKGTIQGDAKLGNGFELSKNSEMDTGKLGNGYEKGGKNSDGYPTDKNTILNKSINNNINKVKKRKHDIPVCFAATEKQISKCEEYGINTSELIIEFDDYHSARGNQFVDWNRAFSTWINNNIKFNKLQPINQLTTTSKKGLPNAKSREANYTDNLSSQLQAKYGQTAERGNIDGDRGNVYDMETHV